MNAPLLLIDRLVVAYGKVKALNGVSLSIPEGSITCLLGPNGAGKTTLMMSIAGFLRPRQGTIRFQGDGLTGNPPHAVASHGIALVPQGGMVFRKMSVRENLWAGAHRRGDKREIEADMARLYARLPRLKERENQEAGTLSGGEQQMLAVARALMSRPRLLLLDEPSFGLAPLVVEDIFRLVSDVNAEGTTIFLVEQNARMALDIAHHAYLIEQGQITFSGTPRQLSDDGSIYRAYLGRQSPDVAHTAVNRI